MKKKIPSRAQGFWHNALFYQHPDGPFSGLGIELPTGLGGVALRAITSNIHKHKMVRENLDESLVVKPLKKAASREEMTETEESITEDAGF